MQADLKLDYRLGVGLVIINKNKQIFVGKRIDSKTWQMPQGGIDPGETPSKAAIREMKEEIGCDGGKIIAEAKNWYCYDLPKKAIPKLWGGKYKGQKQKWFLIELTSSEEEIDLSNSEYPEFEAWKWVTREELIRLIVKFKKKLYISVVREFKHFLTQ